MPHYLDKIWGIFLLDVLFMVMRVVLCGDIVRVFLSLPLEKRERPAGANSMAGRHFGGDKAALSQDSRTWCICSYANPMDKFHT